MHRLMMMAVLISLLSLCCAQDEVVTNGGFELLDVQNRPVDWEILGTGRVVEDSHTGRYAMLLERTSATGGECGLNRRWQPYDGQQGAMLSQLKGGISFWYRADEASDPKGLVFFVIPMNAEPIERTGSPRAAFTIPAHHIGDGQWHQGLLKYDFTDNPQVKWVHLSPRITGEKARLLLDDITWVEHVGPLPTINKVQLEEVTGKEGEECVLRAQLSNAGDQPIDRGLASLTLPEGLTAEGGVARNLDILQPDATAIVTWRVAGRRDDPGSLTVTFAAGERQATASLKYAPALEIVGLFAHDSCLCLGQRTTVTLRLRNTGHAMLRQVSAELRPGAPLRAVAEDRHQVAQVIRPQCEAQLSWQLEATSQATSAPVRALIQAPNAEAARAETKLTVGGPMPAAIPMRPGAGTVTDESFVCMYNDELRLILPRAEFGYGIGILQLRFPTGWQTVGKLPRVSRLVVVGANDQPAERAIFADEVRAIPSPEAVAPEMLRQSSELVATFEDGNGVSWTITETIALPPRGSRLLLRLQAIPAAAAKVLALDGPVFLAGDGAPPGFRRLDAIFPGLEWLVEGEDSSSSLDIAATHPDRIRYVPHPHMVTIPMMAARFASPQGPATIVSLSWDHLQPYYRKHNRPSAMFASPDRFEGRSATVMGLFAPSMPEYISPNNRVAHTPLEVAAGESIELVCQLSVREAAEAETALGAVRDWFTLHGVPEPNPLPHGHSWQEEIEFSMAAYLHSLWIPDQEKWHPSIGGPAIWDKPTWSPAYLYDMRMCLDTSENEAVKQAVRERYERVVELSDLQPEADDRGFQFAGPADRLVGLADQATALIRQQGPDGSWRFRARVETQGVFKGMDYSELGPDNAAEVGTCARAAWTVLVFARMTGDPAATAAGLKALQFMDRFQVPRAAQVWEVPVHTPDILASSDACEAYLEGYLLTGDRQYLNKAVYWAWTGLPFVYTWDTEGYRFLKYASIPVFGATWYQGSWFGRPVQWNGLRYAYALLQLAQHDNSLDWRRVAEGITISAMYQQSTDEKDKALWPDSIGAIDRQKSGWIFAPQMILKNVYALMGLQPTPVTARARADGGFVHVTAAGQVSEPVLEGRRLSCSVTFRPPQSGYVVICNLSRPSEVRVNGTAIPAVERPGNAQPPCWRYVPGPGLTEIRLRGSDRHDIVLVGVEYAPSAFTPKLATSLSFGFDADDEGWRPTHDLDAFRVQDGILSTRTSGVDPYMVRGNCEVPADSVNRLRIRMALEPGLSPGAQVFWITSDDPGWDEPKSMHFSAVADGEFHEYVVPVSSHALWQGTITGLRLDPTGGQKQGQVQIDYIKGE